MVKLKDIAEACGVSVATVSRALNGLTNGSNERTSFIVRTAREMGYYPNAAARTLKTSRSDNIGILYEDRMNHEYFSSLLDALRRRADERGYDLTLMGRSRRNNGENYYEQARRRQEKLEENALADLDFVSGSSPAARLGRELNAKRAEAEHLSAQIATLKGRLSAMGDTMVLRSELGTMETERALIEQEYEDISLAAETLRSADDELQSRFSPELGRVAAEYMSRVTDGRYSQVLINRDFSAMTRTGADAVAHDSSYLSAGTMDLLYLAVRLAVCRLALPEGEPCPLIIDDALVNLDETRLGQAMELLKEIAKERQVILFTCRKIGD